MMNWILSLWYAGLREIDIQILWPECKKIAQSVDHAKAAFAVHAYNDKPWMFLGGDEIYRRIEELS